MKTLPSLLLAVVAVAVPVIACSSRNFYYGDAGSDDDDSGTRGAASSAGSRSPSSSGSSSANPPSSSPPSSGSGSAAPSARWYCGQNGGICYCYNSPVQGYELPTCTGSFGCCTTAQYSTGLVLCACSSSCEGSGGTRVPTCPPP